MELRQLRYALSVAKERSFTRAAKGLNVSQSAVSEQVALLEGDIGFPLFRRTPRGIEVTERGRSFLSLSETNFARIGDAGRPGWGPTEYDRRSEWRAMSAYPYSMTGASGFDCSSLRKIEVDVEDDAHQIRRHGRDSRVGSSR